MTISIRGRCRAATLAVALVLAFGAGYSIPLAQGPAKKPLTVDDYTKWRTIAGQELSPDGKWVTYTLQLTNVIPAESKPVLHIRNLETNEDVAVPDATGGVFSSDSKWIAYQVDPGAAQRARAGRAGAGQGGGGATTPPADPANPPSAPPATPPVTPPAVPPVTPGTPPATPPTTPPAQPPATTPQQPGATQPPATGGRGIAPVIPPRRVELRNLATGTVQSWQEIGTFTFSPAATHLFLKRRAPEGQGGDTGRAGGPGAPGGGGGGRGGAAPPTTGPRGLDVLLVDLRTGRHQLLGSVADIAFNRTGTLLAYTVDAAAKDSNGAFVFDTKTGRITALDTDAKIYDRLAWNEDGNAVAVLKGSEVEKMREKNNVLLAFMDIPAALKDEVSAPTPVVFDPAKAETLPKGWVISDRAPLTWSEDNQRVFFGAKEQVPATDTTRKTTDEAPDVDVWNSADERIQSAQMVRADQDRNFAFRQAFDVAANRFIKLADETMRDIEIAPDGRWAVGRDTRGYISDYKRAAADLYRVDTRTGERTLMLKNQMTNTSTGSHVFGITPHGKQFVYWRDNRFHVYELEAGTTRQIGGTQVSFVDVDFDHPGPRPAFGVVGYSSDGKSLLAQHQYDVYVVPLDGVAPTNLTKGIGTKAEINFRPINPEPPDLTVHRATGPRGTFDLTKPILFSAYGEYTKKAGFYELADGEMKELVYEDAAYGGLTKAAKADRYMFRRETFAEYPDLQVSGRDFKNATKITDANPLQKEYAWGRRILFDFKNKDGKRLQGILALPDDYRDGEKRPMLVTFYEKNSQNLHRYNAPSYLTGMGGSPMQAVSNGYITMLPDVHFRTGSSHSDMLECVEAAAKKVIEMGYADPKRIGINGHSYGGEGAAFIGVMSKMFAAIGVGAGVSDLYNDFSQNWGWAYQYSGGSGANGNDYYLYGQGRWGFSPWEQPERYRFESAITHVPKATAPFLIMHGTSDPTVDFNNGLGFYNALRYNGKKAILLAYPGEGHGLRGMANRKDLTIRYFQFFDHYLKGAPAPKWMTDGVPFIKKEANKDPK